MTDGIGFFLDDLSTWINTPAGATILGNGSYDAFQKPINDDGRVFGFSAALNANGQSLWNLIEDAVNAENSASKKAKAILDAAFTYGRGVLAGRGPSANWFYAQNFQVEATTTPVSDANDIYAGVAATLWAFKQLYPSINSVPVFDSYYLKSLGRFDAATIHTRLAKLGLKTIPAAPSGGGQWNYISTLYYNKLVDGFIGDIYTLGAEGAIPGDALPFYNQQPAIPYAMQSSYEALSNEAGLPIDTAFQGDLAVKASIWVPDGLPAGFNPALYLAPLEMPLGQPGFMAGGAGNDKITGTSANEWIMAGRGRDKVIAGGGDDSVFGQQGNDKLFGEEGRDRLSGGKGKNRCWGGAGADVFVLSGGGQVKVMDWKKSNDAIVVEDVASFEVISLGRHAHVISGDGERLAIVRHAAGELTISETDAFTII
jgi:hypothetical protein